MLIIQGAWFDVYCFEIRSRNIIDYHRAYIGTKMELKPEAFKGIMFKVKRSEKI